MSTDALASRCVLLDAAASCVSWVPNPSSTAVSMAPDADLRSLVPPVRAVCGSATSPCPAKGPSQPPPQPSTSDRSGDPGTDPVIRAPRRGPRSPRPSRAPRTDPVRSRAPRTDPAGPGRIRSGPQDGSGPDGSGPVDEQLGLGRLWILEGGADARELVGARLAREHGERVHSVIGVCAPIPRGPSTSDGSLSGRTDPSGRIPRKEPDGSLGSSKSARANELSRAPPAERVAWCPAKAPPS